MSDLAERLAAARARVVELRGELDDVIASASSTTGDDEHDPEGATVGYERAQAQSMLDRALVKVVELEAALVREAEGGYGTCVDCGSHIGAERLAARPETQRCVTCAAARR